MVDSEKSDPSKLQASLSTLVISIGSSAMMSLGLTPNPHSGETTKDLKMAEFNIDLLVLLKEKTNGNLTHEEAQLLTNVISDLQLKYVQNKN